MGLDVERAALNEDRLEADGSQSLSPAPREIASQGWPWREVLLAALSASMSVAVTVWSFAARWWQSLWLVRFITARLRRRIFVANLIGLAILVLGILYLSQYNGWLVDAKRESLKVQGEVIADALANNTRIEPGRVIVNAENIAAGELLSNKQGDGFPALELSIRPERVAPVLRRLVLPTTRRARVYSLDGTLILDSANMMKRGQLSSPDGTGAKTTKQRTKNFWTRLRSWMTDAELPVYRELGDANGTVYPEFRKAIEGQTTAMLLLNDEGEQIVSTAVPIRRATEIQGVLLMSTPPGEIDQILGEQRNLILILAGIALISTVVSSLLLARQVEEPMRSLSEAAERVSRNITARHDLPRFAERTDEVGQMARAFSAMTASLYRRAEASESFAADVAHELKNPLTAARSMAESLAYAKSDAQRAELVRHIQNELKRLNRLITDVSNASRLDAELARQQMTPVEITDVVQNVSSIFRDVLSDDTRRVKTAIETPPFEGAFVVSGHPGRLGQVLTNLVDNAISFSPAGGTVTVRVRRTGQMVEMLVDDEGPGIPEDRLMIIFDRFYTDRPDTEAQRGKNSGLGLSISREIVRAHRGEIFAGNRRDPADDADGKSVGARFSVRIPGVFEGGPRGGMTSGRRAAV